MMTRSLILWSALALVACDQPGQAPAEPTEKSDEAAKPAEPAKGDAKSDEHDAFANLSPEQVDQLIDKKACTPVDANNSDTRDKYGVLPGAVKLSSYTDFKNDELPADKATKLVFYCGGEKCTAAPKAAKLAKDAGYSDVNVMRAGIKGWVDAGKKVDKPAT